MKISRIYGRTNDRRIEFLLSNMITEIKYSLIQFFRNKGTMFFVFVLPVILLILMGYLSGSQTGIQTLYYIDNDRSAASGFLINALNSTAALELTDGSGQDLPGMLKDGKITAYIEIPPGYGKLKESHNAKVDLYYDRSKITSQAIVSTVNKTINDINMDDTGTKELIDIRWQNDAAITGYMEYLVPGIIGMSIMLGAINLAVGTITGYKASGIFRKLATTPLSRIVWNTARIFAWSFIMILSVTILILASILLYGIMPHIDLISIMLIMAGSIMFTGLGIVIAYFFNNADSAQTAAYAITLPLIFISGSIFPAEQLPFPLRALSALSPLTYLNNGLRNSMIYNEPWCAVTDLAITGIVCIALFYLCTFIMKWNEA